MSKVSVGQHLPEFTRGTGLPIWNRYAAVNDEFVPIHMDDQAGRDAGQDGAFGMGNLQVAYLHNLVRDWLGDDGEIVRISCQFRAVNTSGMIVSAKGTVSAVRESGTDAEADLDVWTEASDGTVLAPGKATVRIFS